MAFIHRSGRVHLEYFPKQASTAITNLAVLSFRGDGGGVIHATVTTTRIVGISLTAVASTDSDYASSTRIPVLVPTEDAVFEADVDTGSAVAADNIGKRYDLASATGITLSTYVYGVCTVVDVISATKVLVKFNRSYLNAGADTN